MRNGLKSMTIVGGVSVVAAVFWLTAGSTWGQQQQGIQAGVFPTGYKAPRLGDGRPDLNGIWQAMTTANIDLEDHEAQAGPHTELLGAYAGWPAGQSVVEGGVIP